MCNLHPQDVSTNGPGLDKQGTYSTCPFVLIKSTLAVLYARRRYLHPSLLGFSNITAFRKDFLCADANHLLTTAEPSAGESKDYCIFEPFCML
jgi:hypothetical protein